MTMPHTTPEPFTGLVQPGTDTPPPDPTRESSSTAKSARHRATAEKTRPSRAELTDEIEATRAALGETVQALAAKTDVKARLSDKADEMRMRGKLQARRLQSSARRNDVLLGAAAGAAGGLLAWSLLRRKR